MRKEIARYFSTERRFHKRIMWVRETLIQLSNERIITEDQAGDLITQLVITGWVTTPRKLLGSRPRKGK